MYLPGCYSMRFTTLSNYYLIDRWCDADFCLFPCWINFRFCVTAIWYEKTGGRELASTIILVLQANRLTKCASHPVLMIHWFLWNQNPKNLTQELCIALNIVPLLLLHSSSSCWNWKSLNTAWLSLFWWIFLCSFSNTDIPLS